MDSRAPKTWEMGQNMVKGSQGSRKVPCFSVIEPALLRNSQMFAVNFVSFSTYLSVFPKQIMRFCVVKIGLKRMKWTI